MKKIFLSFSFIVAFALFATFSRRNIGVSADRFLAPNVSIPVGNTPVPITSAPESVPTSIALNATPMPTPKHAGKYKDGNYVGSVADAYYGNIQVKVVIKGGGLTDVVFLQYPNDRRTSVEINTQAMPYLKSEAIRAQSANVNTISGASDSSQAFRESLGAALAVAKN